MSRPWHFRFDDAVRDSRDLTTSERAVLWALRTHANGRTGEVEARFAPSLTVLGEESGMARRSVSRVLQSVVEKGWLIVHPPSTRDAIRDNHTNGYTLLIPAAHGGNEPSPPRDTVSPGVGTQANDPSDTTSHYQTVHTKSHCAQQRAGSTHAPTAPDPIAALGDVLGSDDRAYVEDVWRSMVDEDGIRHPDRFAAAKADVGELDGYLGSRGWA